MAGRADEPTAEVSRHTVPTLRAAYRRVSLSDSFGRVVPTVRCFTLTRVSQTMRPFRLTDDKQFTQIGRDEMSTSWKTGEPLPGTEVAVVGGGLAGLAAATILGRAGRAAVVFEKASHPGGRAVTTRSGPFSFNLGPHAVYEAGAGKQVLCRLGIEPRGGVVTGNGAQGLRRGRLAPLPSTPASLASTSLLGVRGKLEFARLLAGLGRLDVEQLQNVSVAEWLDRELRQPDARQLVETLLRVSTYAADTRRLSAGTALAQLQRAMSASVRYLDGGWQTLVDQLRAAAEAAGVRIVTGARVVDVAYDEGVREVRLADGTAWSVSATILAVAPSEAASMVAGRAHATLAAWAAAAQPVLAASLDVGLARLPRPRLTYVFGVDEPLYLSVHSKYAKLGPEGTAMIHVMRYLDETAPADPAEIERQLEGLLDLAQPGWRDVVVARRFLPRLVVANALPTAAQGGAPGRPGPAVPDVAGLYVAGDWVGPEGLLSDAALASAESAALAALQAASPARAVA